MGSTIAVPGQATRLLDGTCIDVSVPKPAPPPGVDFLALVTNSLWESGRTLDFHFQNGTDAQKAQFRAEAAEWTARANVLMRFDASPADAEFRVAFGNQGNWSYVGTDNLSVGSGATTMAIQNLSSIRHEVGHALGAIHEHSSPASEIQWNKPVVYQALGGPPNNWSKAMVDHNVFQKYAATVTQFSRFDMKSIMLYPFPAGWTTNGVGTPVNSALSDTDRNFMNRCYPGFTVDFSKPDIKSGNCTVAVGPNTLFNRSYGNSWVLHQPNASFVEVKFVQPRRWDGKDIYKKATLRAVHLTSALNGQAGSSPVDIRINNTYVVRDFSPPSWNYLTNEWDVTRDLVDGPNTVRIDFKNARSNYWIQKLQLDCERAF